MMSAGAHFIDEVELNFRPASQVMDLNRLGTLYPYPLSFMRSLLRRISRDQWVIKRSDLSLDEHGYGHALYDIKTPRGHFTYVIFAKYLDPDNRSDRVIAEDWDMTVTLCEGTVDAERLAFLKANVPLQEKGRVDKKCFVLSRANKSARNFNYVVDRLASGEQPDLEVMAKVGYLYRTTAVYGSGKFGLCDWQKVCRDYPDFAYPFAGEMFSCFLIRDFSLVQADHVAAHKSPETAVKMSEDVKRYVGIGNATGLGMAPYLINHPLLINNWIEVRETALARIKAYGQLSFDKCEQFHCLAQKAVQHLCEIATDNDAQNDINSNACADMRACLAWFEESRASLRGWTCLIEHTEQHYGSETQELVNALLLELYPEYVNDLEERLNIEEKYELVPDMPISQLASLIETDYGWALDLDFSKDGAVGTFWYRSEEKMEPRLGSRFEEEGAEKEMLLGIGWEVQSCYKVIADYRERNVDCSSARFAFTHPQCRYIMRRIQTMSATRYGEIRANLLDADVLPIHLLRCKLSFFGVGKFDPRSRMWVRNTMFQGAPLLDDLSPSCEDHWCFPIKPKLEDVPAH